MLEKPILSLLHINPGKIVKTASNYGNSEYPRTTNSCQYKKKLQIALPEGNSEDKKDNSPLTRLLKRVGNSIMEFQIVTPPYDCGPRLWQLWIKRISIFQKREYKGKRRLLISFPLKYTRFGTELEVLLLLRTDVDRAD